MLFIVMSTKVYISAHVFKARIHMVRQHENYANQDFIIGLILNNMSHPNLVTTRCGHYPEWSDANIGITEATFFQLMYTTSPVGCLNSIDHISKIVFTHLNAELTYVPSNKNVSFFSISSNILYFCLGQYISRHLM